MEIRYNKRRCLYKYIKMPFNKTNKWIGTYYNSQFIDYNNVINKVANLYQNPKVKHLTNIHVDVLFMSLGIL